MKINKWLKWKKTLKIYINNQIIKNNLDQQIAYSRYVENQIRIANLSNNDLFRKLINEHSARDVNMMERLNLNAFHISLTNKGLSDISEMLSGRKKDSKKKISVILPTRNRFDLLIVAIKSIIWQTRLPDEVIIINDGEIFSIENLQEVSNLLDDVCPFVITPNKYIRAAGARRTGLEVASGQIITYLDDDNLMWPTWLESVDREFNVESDQLIYGAQIRKDMSGSILAQESYSTKRILEKNFIDTGTIAHHVNFGSWDFELNIIEDDWDFVLSIASIRNSKIRFVPEIASVYFTDASNRVSQTLKLGHEVLKKKYLDFYNNNS